MKRVDNRDDIFVIEISSCKGQFDAYLLNQINYFNDEKSDKIAKVEKKYQQGKMVLTGYNLKDENYYLGVLSLNGDKYNINNNDNIMNKPMNYSNEVEFLLYYFSIFKKW